MTDLFSVDHNPADIDGRVFLIGSPWGSVWRLTETEARDLSARLLTTLARARNDDEVDGQYQTAAEADLDREIF